MGQKTQLRRDPQGMGRRQKGFRTCTPLQVWTTSPLSSLCTTARQQGKKCLRLPPPFPLLAQVSEQGLLYSLMSEHVAFTLHWYSFGAQSI